MTKTIRRVSLVALIVCLLVTVYPSFNVQAASKKIALNKTKVTLTVGKSTTLKLKNAKASKVKWSSSNKYVASVKKSGSKVVVKALTGGNATITATYKGKKYKCKVLVKYKSLTGVKINRHKITLHAGDKFTGLKAKLKPSDAEYEFNWCSSDESIVRILDPWGFECIAIKAGVTNVWIEACDFNGHKFVDTCKVTVVNDVDNDEVFDKETLDTLKKELGVPLNKKKVNVDISDPFYWEGGEMRLVKVTFSKGRYEASVDCDPETGEAVKSFLPWDKYY